MIATIHHMRLAGDLSMTDLHREDWLRWQGQTPGKLQGLSWDFRGEATWRRRLFWVAGPDRWNTGTGKDCLRRDLRGEDCHPGQEIQSLAALSAAKIKLV